MQLVMVPQLPMEGPEDMVLRFPETWDVQVHNMTGYNRPAVGMEQIQGALKNPIGKPPLRELARGKKEIVIIFDDYTRGMKWQTVAHAVLPSLARPESRMNRSGSCRACNPARDGTP